MVTIRTTRANIPIVISFPQCSHVCRVILTIHTATVSILSTEQLQWRRSISCEVRTLFLCGNSNYPLRSLACLSVRLYALTNPSLRGFSWNLYWRIFQKNYVLISTETFWLTIINGLQKHTHLVHKNNWVSSIKLDLYLRTSYSVRKRRRSVRHIVTLRRIKKKERRRRKDWVQQERKLDLEQFISFQVTINTVYQFYWRKVILSITKITYWNKNIEKNTSKQITAYLIQIFPFHSSPVVVLSSAAQSSSDKGIN